MALGLLNRRWNSVSSTLKGPLPVIVSCLIEMNGDLAVGGFALNDEHSPWMHDQMIDLAHSRSAIELGLLLVDEPQIMKHAGAGIFGEGPVQIERHLFLGQHPGAEAQVVGQRFV